MDDDDLAAVVRSVRPSSSICSTTATLPFSACSPSPKLEPLFPNLTTTDALDSFLWKDYLRTDLLSSILQTPRSLHSHLLSFPFSFPSSAESSQLSGPLPGRAPFSPAVQEVALEPAASHVPPEISDESPCSATNNRGSKAQLFKRRKMEEKRVVCVPAAPGSGKTGGCIPSDLWAWRKYGQKPIKGSPYPRGYYRCSSSKGCSARKQVERSMENPSMLVITYTSDHNHPWFGHAAEECVPSEAVSRLQEKERRASPQQESHVNAPAQPRGDVPGGSAEEKAVTFHPQNELLLSPLEELLYPFGGFGSKMSSADYKSDDEEENASAVDPYNLFNLSSASFHH